MKVLVAHPGKQHSYRTAVALQQGDMLFNYITTTYQKKGSITRLITRFLPEQTRKKAESHYESALDDDKVLLFDEGLALLSLFLEKIKFSPKILRKFNLYRIDHFSQKVAKYAIKNHVDAVIMWDTTSVECFKMLKDKAPHIKRILDCSTANRLYLTKIYDEDMAKYHHECFKRDIPFLWDHLYQKRCCDEIEYAEIYVGASEFVESSYLFSGVKSDAIYSVPYGVDIEKFCSTDRRIGDGPLKLIFVGGVTERKGIHHLLDVMEKSNDSEVVLELVGGYNPESLIAKRVAGMKNVSLAGFVTRDQIVKKYHDADVYVFPTLGEGMTMSGLEAMSTGLPMICSDNAGYNRVIQDGLNGFVFKTGDIDELYHVISRCRENREHLIIMGQEASKTAKRYTWDAYYDNYVNTICAILSQ